MHNSKKQRTVRSILMAWTDGHASADAVQWLTELDMPTTIDLFGQFCRRTDYFMEWGSLCSHDRKAMLNAAFLNDCLLPGLRGIGLNWVTPYCETLLKTIACVPLDVKQELLLYIYMDIPVLLRDRLNGPVMRAVNGFTKTSDPSGLIATWGFLNGQVPFGSSFKALIGTSKDPGPLLLSAKQRGNELHKQSFEAERQNDKEE